MIRKYSESDRDGVIKCLSELQDYERAFEPLRRPGSEIAETYVDTLLSKCEHERGAVFVAVDAETVVGFVCVLPFEPFDSGLNTPAAIALVSDVIVMPEHRSKGYGNALMETAEAFAKDSGAERISLYVLAANPARLFYEQNGYSEYYVKLIKPLS